MFREGGDALMVRFLLWPKDLHHLAWLRSKPEISILMTQNGLKFEYVVIGLNRIKRNIIFQINMVKWLTAGSFPDQPF